MKRESVRHALKDCMAALVYGLLMLIFTAASISAGCWVVNSLLTHKVSPGHALTAGLLTGLIMSIFTSLVMKDVEKALSKW